MVYGKSSIKPPGVGGGAYLFQTCVRGALIETGGLFERGGLFNLAQTMVSVLNKVQKVGGHSSEDQLPVGE